MRRNGSQNQQFGSLGMVCARFCVRFARVIAFAGPRQVSRRRAEYLRANVIDIMSMFPEVHVTLDRPTINHIYQLFLPLVPGGTLVIGLRFTHPRFSEIVHAYGDAA